MLSILYKQWHAAQYSPNSVTYCTSVLLGFFNFSVRKISLLSSRVWSVAFLGCVAYHVQERRVCGERESYILRTRHIKCWLLYKHCHIAALCNNFSSSRSPWYQWFSLTLLKCFVRFWLCLYIQWDIYILLCLITINSVHSPASLLLFFFFAFVYEGFV